MPDCFSQGDMMHLPAKINTCIFGRQVDNFMEVKSGSISPLAHIRAYSLYTPELSNATHECGFLRSRISGSPGFSRTVFTAEWYPVPNVEPDRIFIQLKTSLDSVCRERRFQYLFTIL